MRAILVIFMLLPITSMTAQSNAYLLVGTYTSGKSEGIYVFDLDLATGNYKKMSATMSPNPSFLAVAPNQRHVYAVAETDAAKEGGTGGEIRAFNFDPVQGSLSLINTEFSGGKNPCYVSMDKKGKWVFAANYSSGSAGVFKVKEDGGIQAAQVVQHEGRGPNKNRQDGPHAHSALLSPDNHFLLVQDLGIDKIMVYSFDKISGTLTPAPQPFIATAPGGGPRHLSFHPKGKFAYLVEEMTGQVVGYHYKMGQLTAFQSISGLPEGFSGSIGSADIHVSPNGKFLYSSNRGASNDIAIFKIGGDGKLTLVGHQSSLGKSPRNFNFDPTGNFLLVANQQSDNIVIFKVDKKTGLLTDTGKRIMVPDPVCIEWIKK